MVRDPLLLTMTQARYTITGTIPFGLLVGPLIGPLDKPTDGTREMEGNDNLGSRFYALGHLDVLDMPLDLISKYIRTKGAAKLLGSSEHEVWLELGRPDNL